MRKMQEKNGIHSDDNPISASCFPIVKYQRQAAGAQGERQQKT